MLSIEISNIGKRKLLFDWHEFYCFIKICVCYKKKNCKHNAFSLKRFYDYSFSPQFAAASLGEEEVIVNGLVDETR